jgi:DNA invertase Pin-like site-specific DNA recombinase
VRPAEPETHWRAPLGRWRPSFVVEFVVGIFLDCQKLFATVTDDPMKVAMRQIAGTFAQLEKARLVAKLKAARDRKRAETGKCGGRKSYAEARPDTVALVKELHTAGLSYRKIAAELEARGHVTSSGKPHVASAIQKMLGR